MIYTMRQVILIIALLLTSASVSMSQENITIIDSLHTDESIRDVVELDNGNFLYLKFSGSSAYSYLEALQNLESTLILTNSNLQEINSSLINHEDGGIRILAESIISVNDQIFVRGNALDTISQDTQLCLIWLDLDLNIIKTRFYGIENEQEVLFSDCYNNSGNLVFVGEYPVSSQNPELVFMEVAPEGNLIDLHHTSHLMFSPDIVFLEQDQSYIVGEFGSIYKYDLSFSQVAVYEPTLYDAFFPYGQPLKISDSLYIRTGLYPSPAFPHKTDISRVVFNANAEYSDFEQIVFPEDRDIPAQKIAVSSVDFSTFFLGGTNNSTGFPFVNEDTKFALQKFDLDGTTYWDELYETGGNAVMIQVLALQDGGCLMAGQIYDWHNSQTEQRDLFFIKVDDAGIVTGLEENTPQVEHVSVYPNPGNSQINFSTPEAITRFSMYDSCGRQVLDEIFPGKTINVLSLQAGFYFWVAEMGDGSTSVGKWIKQ